MISGWSFVGWAYVGLVLVASLIAAVISVLVLSLGNLGRSAKMPNLFSESAEGTAFLFDGRELIDATAAGRALLAGTAGAEDAWNRLLRQILPRFPGFEEHVARLPEIGRFTQVSDQSHPLAVTAEWLGGLTRLTLSDPEAETTAPATLDPISQRALEDEIGELRSTMDHAPCLIWRETSEGAVVWANRGYLDLLETPQEDLGWPLPTLFRDLDHATLAGGMGRRTPLAVAGAKEPRWFDCLSRPVEGGRLVFAVPADAAVRAETSLRSFVQTLTKTFADLRVGLAIFDRKRQLVLFNPALIDLTQLSPELLSARPSLTAVLDAMRERRTIPEPKDYKSWRAQMAALEKAAASGQYEETWSLPSGRTYRVTGRPHPDGAVAFLLEDISDEMSLTRRFRAELELSQAMIDGLDEAIAVFSPAGQLVVSNAAYTTLWHSAADSTPVAMGIVEASAWWQGQSAPDPIWDRARDFVATVGPRQAWSGHALLNDGRALDCRFAPVAGGATMVRFVPVPPTPLAAKEGGTRARQRRRG